MQMNNSNASQQIGTHCSRTYIIENNTWFGIVPASRKGKACSIVESLCAASELSYELSEVN